MNLYDFLRKLQTDIGDDCKVGISLWETVGIIFGVRVDIVWFDENDERKFHYCVVLPEGSLRDEALLEHYCQRLIEEASKAFRIAEVGED